MQFFGYALASLQEVEDQLRQRLARDFVDQGRFDTLWDLAEHTKATMLNFKRTHEKPEPKKCARKRLRKSGPSDPHVEEARRT